MGHKLCHLNRERVYKEEVRIEVLTCFHGKGKYNRLLLALSFLLFLKETYERA